MPPQNTLLTPQLQAFSQLTDAAVTERVLAGDHALFELIMRRYNRRLFRVCFGILSDSALAEDAVQETYISAYRHLSQFRGPLGFGAWLTRIGSRAAIRILRQHSPLRAIGNGEESGHLPEPVAGPESDPEALTLERETAHILEQAVALLPREYRLVFILRDLEGLSVEETASSLEVSAGTVKSRLHRARKIVRTRCRLRLDDVKANVFPFAGARCDRIVASVFSALSELSPNR